MNDVSSNVNTFVQTGISIVDNIIYNVQTVLYDFLMEGSIFPEVYNYLYIANPMLPTIYGLPKIHKHVKNLLWDQQLQVIDGWQVLYQNT